MHLNIYPDEKFMHYILAFLNHSKILRLRLIFILLQYPEAAHDYFERELIAFLGPVDWSSFLLRNKDDNKIHVFLVFIISIDSVLLKMLIITFDGTDVETDTGGPWWQNGNTLASHL